MTKKSRTILFWMAVLVFFVVAPLIAFYAQGYRFDFSRGEVVQVGAIIVESSPKDATVFLDNKKLNKKTPLALSSLLPFRFYNIKVEKEDFVAWEKTLLVRPERLSPARSIILFPTTIKLEEQIRTTKADNFYISPNTKFALLKSGANTLSVVDTENTVKPPKDIDLRDGLITFSVDNIRWSENSKNIIFSRKIWNANIWYLFNVEKEELKNITKLYEQKTDQKFVASDLIFLNGDNKLVANIDSKLYTIDPNKEEVKDLNVEGVEHLANFGKKLLLTKTPNILLETNENGENVKLYGNVDFKPSKILASSGGNKIAFMHEHSVGVMWLEDDNWGQERKEGEQEVIFQSPHKIEKFWWHSSNEYILTLLENGYLVATELDSRGGTRNSALWQMDSAKSYSYSAKEKSLWVLGENSLLAHPEDF